MLCCMSDGTKHALTNIRTDEQAPLARSMVCVCVWVCLAWSAYYTILYYVLCYTIRYYTIMLYCIIHYNIIYCSILVYTRCPWQDPYVFSCSECKCTCPLVHVFSGRVSSKHVRFLARMGSWIGSGSKGGYVYIYIYIYIYILVCFGCLVFSDGRCEPCRQQRPRGVVALRPISQLI